MKIIDDLKQVFCKHEDIIWDKVRTMSYPEVYDEKLKTAIKNISSGYIE